MIGAAKSEAQELDWNKRDKPSRFEGIQAYKKKASLELLSAGIFLDDTIQKPDSISLALDSIYISFFVPEEKNKNTTVDITVREYKQHNYWMKPEQKEWENGWCTFSWSANEVLSRLDPVPYIQELKTVARTGETGVEYSRKLIPIIIYKGIIPEKVKAHRFIFRSPDNADILNLICQWYSLEQQPEKLVGEWESLKKRIPAGRPFNIDWKLGNKIKEGWYKLSIKGKLDYPSRTRNLNEIFYIYHQPTIKVQK